MRLPLRLKAQAAGFEYVGWQQRIRSVSRRTRRGRIERASAENGRSEITAIVPIGELLHPGCRELAEFPADFHGYEPISDDGNSSENGAGVTANKPDSPRYRKGSEAIRPDSEEG